jgi:hypothetical protein
MGDSSTPECTTRCRVRAAGFDDFVDPQCAGSSAERKAPIPIQVVAEGWWKLTEDAAKDEDVQGDG